MKQLKIPIVLSGQPRGLHFLPSGDLLAIAHLPYEFATRPSLVTLLDGGTPHQEVTIKPQVGILRGLDVHPLEPILLVYGDGGVCLLDAAS
ncbi:MAG: hypothetical protein EOP06_14775, partial [Proteobacteria bacterium]